MAKQKNKNLSPSYSALWLLSLGASLVTLYFNSKIQDPFNSPKLWILTILSAWSIGYLAVNFNKLMSWYKKEFLVIVFFLSTGFISFLLTNPIYTGLFGENQRRNGFLSYLSLSIILLAGMMYINFFFIKKFSYIVILVGLVLSVYGLMQISGLDFVKWNNPYNAVISTVGNPNFAAAIMSILATLNFGFALNSKIHAVQRIFHISVFILSLIAIFQSDARQGLVSLAIGIGVIVIVFIHSWNRTLGWLIASTSFIIGLLAIAGMLQKGPLVNLLYKDSVSVRGYYWRAGLEMLKDNILFGVGHDRYGAYFKAYRETEYSLKYGFDITSTNAHNVPIQLFATGGIFFGFAYLSIVLLVLVAAYKGIKKSNTNQRLFLTTIFAGWLAYQAQSLISIDNLGISIWGWLLSGFVIGLSSIVTQKGNELGKPIFKNQIMLKQPLISGSFALAAIILVSVLYKGEDAMFQTRIRFNPQDANNKNLVLEYATKAIETPLIDPAYKIASLNFLASSGFVEKALEGFNTQLNYDQRNLDVLNPLAEINEKIGRIPEAIEIREKIRILDPWNTRNLLQLGREYKYIGNLTKMEDIKKDILEFDNSSKESEAAKSELVVQ